MNAPDQYFSMACRPVNRSCARHKNRVLRVERGQRGGIIVIDCIDKFFSERIKLLDYLWIDRVFLLGEGWHSTAQPIASPSRASRNRIFIVSSLGEFKMVCRLRMPGPAPKIAHSKDCLSARLRLIKRSGLLEVKWKARNQRTCRS